MKSGDDSAKDAEGPKEDTYRLFECTDADVEDLGAGNVKGVDAYTVMRRLLKFLRNKSPGIGGPFTRCHLAVQHPKIRRLQ